MHSIILDPTCQNTCRWRPRAAVLVEVLYGHGAPGIAAMPEPRRRIVKISNSTRALYRGAGKGSWQVYGRLAYL